ncbi:flagellar hook-basal body complex protein [Octadecabacter sp. 1_MG-2023]|uniref:flagellar hook protein FlgE n=1 Tax=unclassified Octadecabacter TaxID=196158 RepID=UPI001C0867A6|nr:MULTISPECIES: flagellar hook-basal body complex protein [unclassified Octadecabacter]MBU2992365.1 flagellar hook-basal body complex protein [Octadecabacter sp. B2R22]MDO6734878.1 flagellar hook-basal body complex protein [Octadecabacter sp. 1_MG-2023]
MTISSSLNAGVAGLAANASRLATISDNIANSATYGYKRSVADFHSMVIGSNKGTYTAGGVRVTTQRMIDERGPLVATSNATDLAVRGTGMLPVTEGSSVTAANGTDFPMRLASTGSFRPDSDGYLTTTSGLVLLGWPADPDGTIPAFPRDSIGGLEPIKVNSQQFASDPTTQIELAVNLPATETEAGATGDTQELSIEYFDNLGTAENLSISFSPTVPATGASNEWTMIIEDSSDGTIVGNYTLQFDDSPGLGGRLLSVTDSIGGAYDAAEGIVSVAVSGGNLDIDIDIGLIGEADGMTQLSDTFAPISISKDGSPVGNMTSVEVDENGYVHAFFDTGISRKIYQVPLVDVSNYNGLGTQDHQSYSVTPESGEFYLWDATDGPTGDIVSYAREESATDVAGELTNLIQTQRAYSSNAKVIQTVDEMLQETTNIKR